MEVGLAQPPNVVLIVSDDQGYRDMGCFGSPDAITPNLDRLASEGMKLTSFYVSWPACTPSRGSLLTGRYPQRNGIYDMIRNEAPDYGYLYPPAEYDVSFERIGGMDTREVLLPQMLKTSGYQSAIFGKWDLGSLRRFLPLSRGFDRFYGFVNTGIDYFTHERYGIPSMYRNYSPTEEDKGTYCTELFLREAKDFLTNVPQGKPFFLYVPFNAPHNASNLDPFIRSGAQATESYRALYPNLLAEVGTDSTERYGVPNQKIRNRASKRLEYLASISQMDSAIGEILDLLKAQGKSENTIVIFFSDNGGSGGSDNSPLRGGKGQMFEGGIRVPCIVRFPGNVPAGSESNDLCSSIDLVPTLLEWTRTPPPQNVEFDGSSLVPFLTGGGQSPRREMFWQRREDRAARFENWKWILTDKGEFLFDLSQDLSERENLALKNPAQLQLMRQRFQAWETSMAQTEPRGPFRDY
ncbi:MAG: sulfatase-like hydrolase/transferase [Planctomycetales bacterium]|nr:sulfatase-like hydrolase/transferase [Planctomycetales bacterium]